MYLRPTPVSVDAAVPGSTRRQQISVRPGVKDTTRGNPPPPKRATLEAAAERNARRERPSEPAGAQGPRPPASRPRPTMVVSPVSLTQEEVQPGARPKQPTLLGLGAALGTLPRPGASSPERPEAPERVDWPQLAATDAAAPGSGRSTGRVPSKRGEGSRAARREGGTSAAPAGSVPSDAAAFEAPAHVEAPEDITQAVTLLADFALKLSLGPVSRLWVPEVRRSVDALLLMAKHRHETALAALSARLLELLPGEAEAVAEEPSPTEPAASAADAAELVDGALRESIVHEVSRLAGVLPEWPAPAQDLAEEARRREARVVRELLAQVDGLKSDQRARLEQQMGLEELLAMAPEALADELEAPPERGSELRQALVTYCQERQTRAPDVGNAVALGLALGELERQCQAFEACDPEQKEAQRRLRTTRRRALSVVNLLLAERGELEWLEQLEPLSIGERLGRLRPWLEGSRERAD